MKPDPGATTRARVFAIVVVCLVATAVVVWRVPSVDKAIALMLAVEVLAAALVWRQLVRPGSSPAAEQPVEAERVATVLEAAKNGDLTLRTQVREGRWARSARASTRCWTPSPRW